MNNMPKLTRFPYIFVIGFNKSGTTSIHRLFLDNGFPAVHWDQGRLACKALLNTLQNRRIFEGYDQQYRVFSDLTFRNSEILIEGNKLFRQMDRNYPGAYFLYNKREMNAWLNSRLSHGSSHAEGPYRDYFKKILRAGDDKEIMAFWKKTRLRFEEDIREYFGDSDRFIELEIEDAMFVKKLSYFIGVRLNPDHWKRRNVRSSC